MQSALRTVDITDSPELTNLAEEVERSGVGLLLKQGGREVAILMPVDQGKAIRRRRRLPGKPTTPEDPYWNIIGMGESEGPDDVSENKYKYLADAYDPPRP